MSFRYGFFAGLFVAVIFGTYLVQLWQPTRQVQLHSEHLIGAVQAKDWKALGDSLDEGYRDQWNQDRPLVLTRMREVLRFARNLHLVVEGPLAVAAGREGTWRARVTVEADENEIATLIKSRVNNLDAPFELRWQQKSWKPWDWKLVRISNTALELPAGDL